MQYKDQFVLNGNLNEIGEAISENVADSHRAGIELAGAWKPCSMFRWDANVTLSQNQIKDYAAYLLMPTGAKVLRNLPASTPPFPSLRRLWRTIGSPSTIADSPLR